MLSKSKVKKIARIAVFIMLGMIFLPIIILKIVYPEGTLSTAVYGLEDANETVLIAGRKTEFKEKLIEGLVEHYLAEDVRIEVKDISSLSDIEPKTYAQIIIINSLEIGKQSHHVRSFLQSIEDEPYLLRRVAILITTANNEWLVGEQDYDVYTSASTLADIPVLIEKLTAD